jgi:SAM-dependent methyltransferase
VDLTRLRPLRSWRAYWAECDDPLHRDGAEFYRQHARELKLLLGATPGRVLEVGCGNGVFYELLDFDKADYTGVDFSPAMIGAFRARHPRARLILADAEDYREGGPYDLIFSNQLVQYLDKPRLARLLANARTMLVPTGCVVAASVPCRALRRRYYTGELTGGRTNRVGGACRVLAGYVGDGIGHWYSFEEIAKLAERHGLRSELFGSMHYPYRFHVRLTPAVPTRS